MVNGDNPSVGYPYQAPFSILSALSCSFMICLSLLYKKSLFNHHETKLVIILLIFYDGLCLSSLLPVFKYSTNSNEFIHSNCTVKSSPDMEDNTDALCNLQGFLIQFFSLSGIIWTGVINYNNYRGIILKKTDNLNIKIPLITVIVFGFITSAVPLAHVGYQESTCWCWFNISKSSNDMDHLKRFYWVGFFYAISWAIIIFILFVFIKTWIVYRDKGADFKKFKSTMFIPIILFICFIPLTISRCIAITGKSNCELLGFSIFSSCVMRSLGFLNSLVYGYHSGIRTVFTKAYLITQSNNESEAMNKFDLNGRQDRIDSNDE